MSIDEVNLVTVGRAHLANRGYAPAVGGPKPVHQSAQGWVVQRRRGDDPSLREYMQDQGVPGSRPWGSLYEVKIFWSWKEAQSSIRLQREGGMAVRLKSLETPERPLVPSSTLTIGELGL
jgi:hypothetical protein